MKKFSLILIVLLAGVLFVPQTVQAQNIIIDRGIVFGAKAGVPVMRGPFNDYFTGQYSLGLSMFAPAFYIKDNMQFEADLDYSRFSHDRAEDSFMSVLSVAGGISFFWEWNDYINPYAGASFQPSFIYGSFALQGREETTIRGALLLKAGNSFYISRGVGIRTGIELSATSLSAEPFGNLKFNVQVTFNFASADGERKTRLLEADQLERSKEFKAHYEQGVSYLAEFDVENARTAFRQALELNPDHQPTQQNLRRVNGLEKQLIAHALVKNGDYFRALPIMVKAAQDYEPAKRNLRNLRSQMRGDVRRLERQGENEFAREQYSRCIRTMRKLQLVDPGNKIAKVYLGRAKKRQKALKTLR